MNVKIQFIIFFLIFILIYISLNSYVFLRLGGLLGIQKNFLYLLILLFTFSLPFAMYIERVFPNILSRIFYTVAALWMGILLFILCLLLLYEIIRLFYAPPYAGMIIVIMVSILSIISIINATRIVVKEIKIPIKNLEKNITIVQLSDIHVGTIMNSGFLKKIIKEVDQLNPDIVMITGDMIDASARLHKDMFSVFNQLKAEVYFVTGNHEIYEGADNVYVLFNNTKIRALKNEVVNSNGIQVIGIEFSESDGYLEKELEKIKIDKTKPAVLMYHSPQGVETAKKIGINLQLSGHTHFGQIFPFNFLVNMFFKYINGLYKLGDMFLYVSPGTGTWGPYMRLGSNNEITVLKLIKDRV